MIRLLSNFKISQRYKKDSVLHVVVIKRTKPSPTREQNQC